MSNLTTDVNDQDTIAKAVQHYIDGARSGKGEDMKLRASLICEIRAKVTDADWMQTETARQLGITQPRVSDLLSGKLSKFSLDTLVNMLAKLGSGVELRVA